MHKIDLKWDNDAWYACLYDKNDEVLIDSQKVYFPINLDEFAINQRNDVINALIDAFDLSDKEWLIL